jgi:hypothetical protein
MVSSTRCGRCAIIERAIAAGWSVIPAAIALAVLLAVPASVFAKQARLFAGSFGSASSLTANPYPLSEPRGVAVDDAAHDVYVADTGNHRVEKFSAAGEFLLAFGADVGGPGVNVCGLGLVPCTAGTPGSAPGQLANPTFIAVDDSSGPSKGDIYVADTGDDIVSKFDGSGNLVSGWGKNGQLDGSNVTKPPAPFRGPFERLFGVAVDPSGDLWVNGSVVEGPDQQRFPLMFEFKQDGGPITDAKTEGFSVLSNGISVDSEDNLYLAANGVVEYFPNGRELGVISSGEGRSVAVDPSNKDIYIGTGKVNDGEVSLYDASCHPVPGEVCTPVEHFGSGHLGGDAPEALAVDPTFPTVYVLPEDGGRPRGDVVSFVTATVPDVSTVAASNPTFTSATLNGTVNPDGVSLREGQEGCRFEWGETTAYGHSVPCAETATQVGSGFAPVAVHAELSGLSAGTTYHFRLVAGNPNDVNERLDEPSVGSDVAFGPPLIEGESVSNVSATSATAQAVVSPQNVDTRFQVEYGTDASYGHSSPWADVGGGAAVQSVSEHLQDLTPDTVYHYRLVASSVLGTTIGEDRTFTTQPGSTASVLPDARRWELVSPPDKHGATFYTPGAALFQASSSGGMVSYPVTLPTEASAEGYSESVQILSARAGGGWSSQDISLPHSRPVGDNIGGSSVEYLAFSQDLSVGLVEPSGPFTSLAPHAFPPDSERTPYLRHDATCSSDPSTCYEPLATGVEGYEDVLAGTKFGGRETGVAPDTVGKVNFVSGTRDMRHVIVKSTLQLTQTAVPPGLQELYEWSADKPYGERLQLVSRLENQQPASAAAGLGFQPGDTGLLARNAVSSDGSRVVWTEERGGLYVWSAGGDRSVRLDVAREGASGAGNANPVFQVASSDVSRVFFTDEQRLTTNSGAHADAPDLYECDIVEREGGMTCEIQDLTPARNGESAAVVGTTTGASEDGSWAYFVANGVLGETAAEGAVSGSCSGGSPLPGASCNLYALHRGAAGWESPRLVAVLSGEDTSDWAGGDSAALAGLTARVSANGSWLAFMSKSEPTGYDNHDALSGAPDAEVYIYHAHAGEGGRLVCVSCNPTGARPDGVEYAEIAVGLVKGPWDMKAWLAASVPGYTNYKNPLAIYQPRYLSDEGRLFFDSGDALVPQDVNGNQSVYEYEPVGAGGAGGCAASAPSYSSSSEGCVDLISSGSAIGESVFVDASESGDDVFFLTRQGLSSRDIDSSYDMYDAHACASISPCSSEPSSSPACESADACRAAPEPEPIVFGAPPSTALSGNGNEASEAPTAAAIKPRSLTAAQKLNRALKACRKVRSKRKRNICERQARRRHRAVPVRGDGSGSRNGGGR